MDQDSGRYTIFAMWNFFYYYVASVSDTKMRNATKHVKFVNWITKKAYKILNGRATRKVNNDEI